MQVNYFQSLPFGLAAPLFAEKNLHGQMWFFSNKILLLNIFFISSKNKTKEDHSKRKVETYIFFIEDVHLLMNTIKIRHHFAYLRNLRERCTALRIGLLTGQQAKQERNRRQFLMRVFRYYWLWLSS